MLTNTPVFNVHTVKFYTLDDSVMFTLKRVTYRSSPAPSPLTPRPPLKHTRSTSALPNLEEESEVVHNSSKIYSSNVLAAAAAARGGAQVPVLRQIST
jgi:hypothetical protein